MEEESSGEVRPADRYREYWAYLRHIETVRMTFAGLFATVAATLLAVVNLQDTSPAHTSQTDGLSPNLKASILLFLAVFVSLAVLFLVLHKVRYDEYFDRALALEPESKGAQRPERHMLLKVLRLMGPFEALLLLLLLVQSSVAVSAVAIEGEDPTLTGWVMVAGIGLSVLLFVVHAFRKVKRLLDDLEN